MISTVLIAVFGLFHPTELAVRSSSLAVQAGERRIVLDGAQALRLRAAGGAVEVHFNGEQFVVTKVAAEDAEFVLSVPGKIERRFRGALQVASTGGELRAVVAMDLEIAVASAVAAESPPGASMQALMAQAVATRSYYAGSRGRHAGFDFCDTTHCQFLRHPPARSSAPALATQRTRGLALFYRGAVLAALFSASCGGRTRALPHPAEGEYPYFEVECPYCRRGPRVHCSYCDPNDASAGHGHGLCQTGAKEMAARGASFREILRRYFPNTETRPLYNR